ncbi:MAG: hypothetical protein J0I73_08655 [Sphingomonas sp.]|uniref:putative barnase/colicin E5 family endoribonuclease n=1 Tax=Sphingomonas sp. TaxID=28214 RepID=UPI001AC7B83B|nr:hypothetical protein [Sphingomonas sp.]MBN8848150.1 hypothetical protein [Sphingomonas sp.]
MTDRPSLLSLDSPTDAYRALRPRGPGVPRPVDPPSVWSQFSTAAKSSAGLDEIAEARRQKAVDDGYATIIDELNRRGLASDRYSWRLPLPGAQPFYNEDAIWQGVGEARKRDPKAFADIGKDPTAFRAARTAPVDAADADRQRILKQSGWAPWLAGQFYGGFSDPINQAGMLVGAGGARSIAQAALRDAGINLAIEAAQAPSRAIERAGRGVETTPGSVASELALAAGTGALFGGALKAGEQVAPRVSSTAGDLARQMREAIGWDRMTDAEQAATRSLEREDQIVASSPFRPGRDTEQYAAQVDALVQAASAEQPSAIDRIVPLNPAPRQRPSSSAEGAAQWAADPWEQFKLKVRRAESGGDDAARSSSSSATGRYQVVDATWLRVARDLPEAKGMGDAGLLGMRTHPVWQEKVMDRLGVEYRSALSRIGAPETPGNLYLMHFAGTGGASKILRAAADTPIDELLSKAAIDANPFLRGRTAEDVIEWAHGRVGGARDGAPVLRRDIFPDDEGGDVAWREAQREVDAANRDWEDFQREDGFPRRADDIGDDDIPFDLDDPRTRMAGDQAAEPDWTPVPDVAPSRWSDALADLRAGRISEASGVLAHPALDAPIDVKWGAAGDPARDFKGGYGLAHILAKHPEMEAELERLPQLIADMAVMRDDARRERLELQSPTHEAAIALTWHGKTQHWLVTAYEKGTPDRPLSARLAEDGGNGSTRPGEGGNIGETAPIGNATPDMERYWASSAAEGPALEPLYAVSRGDGGEPLWWSPSRAQAERMAREEGGPLTVDRIDPPDAIAPATRAEMLGAFDDPAGDGATHQIDSLEHDLRMWLAEDEAAGLTVRLNEEGDVVSAADALHDLDQDEAAIAAARACMAPNAPGGE